jgi:hypothetical protein
MPIDPVALQHAATGAFDLYRAEPARAVRGGLFSATFEQYAQLELERLGLPPQPISSRGKVIQDFSFSQTSYFLGGHYLKNVDVTLHASTSGPLLSVSLKSMLSSIEKNVNNRWEEAIGDAANMHARFPMLVFGYLVILPTVTRPIQRAGARAESSERIIAEDGTPTALAAGLMKKLSAARGRKSATDLPSYYEEIAVAVFDANPPYALHPTFPSIESGLRIEEFFDRLVERYQERNPNL